MVMNPNNPYPPQPQQAPQMSPQQMMMQQHLQSSPMNPKATIGHLLALLDSVITDPQMNMIDKVRHITPLTKSISEMITADKAESSAGLSPDQQMQIEQQKHQLEVRKAQHEMSLKEQDQQHKQRLAEQDQKHKHGLEIAIQLPQAASQEHAQNQQMMHSQQQHEHAMRTGQLDNALKVDQQEHDQHIAEGQMKAQEKKMNERNGENS